MTTQDDGTPPLPVLPDLSVDSPDPADNIYDSFPVQPPDSTLTQDDPEGSGSYDEDDEDEEDDNNPFLFADKTAYEEDFTDGSGVEADAEDGEEFDPAAALDPEDHNAPPPSYLHLPWRRDLNLK